ncbi:MAG: hypothetical protein RL722_106 [Pseudomonadota bacterium]|jgi:putative FmdB family regulatory protein
MPIYAYRCSSCGHAQDVLRKISDPPLTTCPACQAETYTKQLTAAGFQLKGSGWYATDFRGGGSSSPAATSGGDGGGSSSTAPAAGGSTDSGSSSTTASAAAPTACGGSCACH